MDPNMAAAFARILQDPNLVASLSQSASQPSPFPSNPVIPLPPPSFPPFCTQPPAPPAPSPSVPSKAKPSSRSGRRHRVSASLEPAVDPAVDPKKKMYYSTDEDIRLVSAWLDNSTDPIEGVNRKGETYWTKVAEVYNLTTPPNRQRDPNCLKSHWHKCSRKVALFNGCYVQLRDVPVSGRNDEQLMEEALALYSSRANGKQFKLMHWWKAVCDSPKWNVHANNYGNGARKFTPDLNMNPPLAAQARPMGVKRAKKAKGTSPEVAEAISM